jgi:hypothetical protein
MNKNVSIETLVVIEVLEFLRGASQDGTNRLKRIKARSVTDSYPSVPRKRLSHTLLPNISQLQVSLRLGPTGDNCVGVSRDVTQGALSSRSLSFYYRDASVQIGTA